MPKSWNRWVKQLPPSELKAGTVQVSAEHSGTGARAGGSIDEGNIDEGNLPTNDPVTPPQAFHIGGIGDDASSSCPWDMLSTLSSKLKACIDQDDTCSVASHVEDIDDDAWSRTSAAAAAGDSDAGVDVAGVPKVCPDFTRITARQRHAFAKCLTAQPGSTASRPLEIRMIWGNMDQEYIGLRDQITAFVNFVIPKDVADGVELNFSDDSSSTADGLRDLVMHSSLVNYGQCQTISAASHKPKPKQRAMQSAVCKLQKHKPKQKPLK